jgi:DNA-directed RNA polymerase specialized sigma24 family protein
MAPSQTTKNDAATPPTGEIARQAVFATTHWSVVLTAGRSDSPQAQASLERLCQTYWLPLYAYVRRRGYCEADAKDLTQGFFAWLLQRDWLERADQQRGRFRSFLLTTLNGFLSNEWDKAHAQKRDRGRTISLSFDAADAHCGWEPADNVTPEQTYEWRWALTLLDQVMGRLRADYGRQGKTDLFEQLKPCLLGDREAQPYAALASKLGVSEGSVKVAVHRLRRRYRELLREEIANTVARPEDIEEEMRYLFAVFARR